MFDEIKRIVEESRHSNKGFQVIIKNLDDGKEIVNSKTKAVIGAFAQENLGGAVAVQGMIYTSCDTPTLIGTIKATEEAVATAKKKLVDGLPPEVILAALLGGKRE